MKFLKKLNQDERTVITSSAEPFFLVMKKAKAFDHVFKELINLFPIKYEKEVRLVITAVAKAMRYGSDYSQFSLDHSSYKTANDIHNQGLSKRRSEFVIKSLDQLGYIELYMGYFNDPEDFARTVFKIEDKFKSLFKTKESLNCASSREDDDIEVRCNDGNRLQTKGIRGIKDKKVKLKAFNKELNNHEIRICGHKVSVEYKRVFSGDIVSGGRFYTKNGFQNAKSRMRNLITIDGCKVTEVDISTIHPRLLACELGISLDDDFDVYNVTLSKVKGCKTQLRKLCKAGMMCILYNKNKQAAISALVSSVKNDKLRQTEDKDYGKLEFMEGCYSEIINKLIENNKMISDGMFKEDLWKPLQYKDSCICEYVIDKFVGINEVCLCYHDSWVVKEKHRQFLIDCIREGWHNVTGTYDNFKYKIDY